MTTGDPISTIREFMEGRGGRAAALTALTEVEHQLEAGLPILSIDGRYVLTSKWAKEQDRAVAAETALAECRGRTPDGQVLDPYEAACLRADEAEAELDETAYHLNHCRGLLEAAERRTNDLEHERDAYLHIAEDWKRRANDLADALRAIADYGHEMDDYVLPPKEARKIARAALDRQEQRDGT